ncbi:MAG TPA: hypothetical protein VFN10_19325 [Thermoanaerobaculia bacterium]|nr:hypothetical protein [Thermoanaerobaculia bacterium]
MTADTRPVVDPAFDHDWEAAQHHLEVVEFIQRDLALEKPDVAPTLTRIEPNALAQGTSVDVDVSGTNLALATALKLARGANEIIASDVTSDASVVRGTLTIPDDATVGKWDVTVETSDAKMAKLAAAFEVTPKAPRTWERRPARSAQPLQHRKAKHDRTHCTSC